MKKIFILTGIFILIVSSTYGQSDDNSLKLLKELKSAVNNKEHR